MKLSKINLLIITLSLTLFSCMKAVDLFPTDSFDESKAFESLEDVQKHVNTAYSRYNAYQNTIYISTLLSDEAKLGAGNAGQGALQYRFQFSSDATTGGPLNAAYTSYYSMIDQVNRILDKIDEVPLRPGEETRKNILKGQMLGLRALGHFELLRFYAKKYDPTDRLGISIMTAPDLFAQPARSPTAEVITQIKTDIQNAKSLLPAVSASSFSDTVINQLTLTAYQARLALYEGDYSAAIDYSTDVINSGLVRLLEISEYPGFWTDDNIIESLFRIRNATSTALATSFTLANGLVYIAPSTNLELSFTDDDVRKNVVVRNSPSNGPYTAKYFESAKGQRVVDTKVLRLSELYLIRAEAYLLQPSPNVGAAGADLIALRQKRITDYVDEVFTDAATLLEEVELEKFKELAFEGQRFLDIKRRGKSVERHPDDANEEWRVLEAGSYRFALPIPLSALNANPNAEQNPGYN